MGSNHWRKVIPPVDLALRHNLLTHHSVGGMGEGHLNAFLSRGINVIATSIDMGLLENLTTNEGKDGAYVVRFELDVTSPESIESAVERVARITDSRLDFLLSK